MMFGTVEKLADTQSGTVLEHTVTGPPQDLEQKRVLEQQEL